MISADPLAGAAPAPAVAAESVRTEVGNIPAIEGLRGVAVLWVMAFHFVVVRDGKFDDAFIAFLKDWPVLDVFVRNGYLGVDLFFLITGFLLTLPWFRHADAGMPAPDWRTFYVRRARRILPAYYVQLVFLFFVVVPILLPRIWIQSTPFVAGNLGAHFLFLHYTSPLTSSSMTVNGALWTLAIEAQYYLLVPFVAPLFVKWPLRCLAASFAIAAGWRWLAWHDLDWLAGLYLQLGARAGVSEKEVRHLIATQLPAWAFHFGLGIVLGRAWMLRAGKPLSGWRQWKPFALAALAAWALHGILRGGTAFLGEMGWAAFPVVLAAGFGAIVSWRSPAMARIAGAAPLAWMGRVSYSAYLYHLPLLLLLNAHAAGTDGALAPLAYLATVLAAAAASYRLVERPYLAGANHSKTSRSSRM